MLIFLGALRSSGFMQHSMCSISNLSEISKTSADSNDTLIALQPTKGQFKFVSIENKDIIELSAVFHSKTIWVRPIKCDELYIQLLTKSNLYESSDDIVDYIEKDSVVLAKYCGDYSRGIVLDVDADADTASILLMDIGHEVNVKRGK